MQNEPDPDSVRMLFLRVGWMERYQGITRGDRIVGGGTYVEEHGVGHEIFNFRPFRNTVYGYVQPPARSGQWADAKINVTRLGVTEEEESVSGVLVIWVATSPSGAAS